MNLPCHVLGPIQIVICDDHQIVIDGLKLILEQFDDICVKSSFTHAQELNSYLKQESADVLLLDINMPDLDGISAAKVLAQDHPDLKIIFLSMINQLDMIGVLQQTSAKAYLLKNASPDELYLAIYKVYNGGMYFDDRVIELDPEPPIQTRPKPKITKRERDVLRLIVAEHTAPEIAKLLYISTGTVETHRRNLMSKLCVKNTAGLVRECLTHGLLDV